MKKLELTKKERKLLRLALKKSIKELKREIIDPTSAVPQCTYQLVKDLKSLKDRI